MLLAKKGRAELSGGYIDYVSFGSGNRNFVILPGLSILGIADSPAVTLANMYRLFSKDYKVYFLDRKSDIPEGYSIWDIADDTAEAMKALGIENASVMGVSQGGMIAQALALRYPDVIEKLVLCATLSRPNETAASVIGKWVEYAEQGDFESLNTNSFSLLYTEEFLKKNRLMLPAAAKMRPKDPKRFINLARSCITFDAYDELDRIKCPVLVLGADGDKVVTGKASEEIAKKLGCEIYMYDGYSHAVYDEAKDFKQRIYDFLKK